MTPTPVYAWAIKAPDGRFIAVRFSQYALEELLAYLEAARGKSVTDSYRCVRVQITELPEVQK